MTYFEFLQIALPKLLEGLVLTLEISAGCLVIGFVIGFPAALARVYGPKWLRWIVTAYIEILRGTPALVQLFLVYYGLPQLNITLSAFASAFLALGLNSSAYQAEYFRGAIQAIKSGQMMAARSIGMTKFQAIQHVIIPQAFRFAIPAWSNEAISMIKMSSIVYLITVPEMMNVAKELVSRYYNPFEAYITAGVIYMVVIGVLSWLLNKLEKALTIPGLEVAKHH